MPSAVQAKQGSFLGLASSVSQQGASRSTFQQGNARSYIFGNANDSNSAAVPSAQVCHNRCHEEQIC